MAFPTYSGDAFSIQSSSSCNPAFTYSPLLNEQHSLLSSRLHTSHRHRNQDERAGQRGLEGGPVGGVQSLAQELLLRRQKHSIWRCLEPLDCPGEDLYEVHGGC